MKISEQEYAIMMAKKKVATFAKALRAGKAREMNKTEAAYRRILGFQMIAGHITSIKHEAIKLRLADNTTYTPDFEVVLPDGKIELHEVKGGFTREDAWIKFKVARELYPEFKFVMAQCIKGEWRIT
jgi:hypothetical protein